MDSSPQPRPTGVLNRAATRRGVVAALSAAAALGTTSSDYTGPAVRRIGLNPSAAFLHSGTTNHPTAVPTEVNPVVEPTKVTDEGDQDPPVRGVVDPGPPVRGVVEPGPQSGVVGGEVVVALPSTGVGMADD